MPVLFCFGLGYIGARLARQAQTPAQTPARQDGDDAMVFRVVGTSSRRHAGIEVIPFEDEEGVRLALEETTHLVSCVPPDEGGDAVLARYGDALRGIPWLCYCSSLSVYGDHGGSCVEEWTPPALPLSKRGERRLRAEREWQKLADGIGARLCLLRIAGIYGEGRNALLRLRAKEKEKEEKKEERPIVCSEGVFNRIHVEDLVTAILCAARGGSVGIFNICDDFPARSHEPFLYAAELLGCGAPALVSSGEARASGLLSDMAWSFHGECKRASNEKMKRELGVRLRYPDYRRGLEALVQRLRADDLRAGDLRASER